MMRKTFLLLMAAVAAATGSAQVPAAPTSMSLAPAPVTAPTDWATMPQLPWRMEPVITPELTAYVVDEVRSGRCAAAPGVLVEVPVAVFVRSNGAIGATVPQAIGCPTVEQFAAGLVSSFARNRLRMPVGGWYQTTMSFAWDR